MNIYLISQEENQRYDTYDSAVVFAFSEQEAKNTHPSGYQSQWGQKFLNTWASSPDKVEVLQIGEAHGPLAEGYVVCASFNAG